MDDELQEHDYGAHPIGSSEMIIDIPKNQPKHETEEPGDGSPSNRSTTPANAIDDVNDDGQPFPQSIRVEKFDRKSTENENIALDEERPAERNVDPLPKAIAETITAGIPSLSISEISEDPPLPRTNQSVDSENGDQGFEKLNADEAEVEAGEAGEERETTRNEKSSDPIVVIPSEPTRNDDNNQKIPVTVGDDKGNGKPAKSNPNPNEKDDKKGCPFSENRHLVLAVGGGLALLAIVLAAKRLRK